MGEERDRVLHGKTAAKVNHFVTFAVNYTAPNCFVNLAENSVGSLLVS